MNAHGKIILIGEHSVVYGKSAIALPLTTLQTTCTITPSKNTIIQSPFYNGPLQIDHNDVVTHTILNCVKKLNKQEPLHYKIQTTIPAQRGFGSSAAVAISIVKALYQYYQQPLSDELLYELVLESEKVAHINPSGLDIIMCSQNTPYYYTKNQRQPIDTKLNSFLLIADSGIPGKTSTAIKYIQEHYQEDRIDTLHTISEFIYHHYHENYIQDIGLKLNEAHFQLKKLGVSHPKVDEYVELCQQHSLGAKMSGGGLGGCFIALLQTEKEALHLKQLLQHKGVKNLWIQPI